MTVRDATLPPVRGLIDRDGRLIDADQRLLDLNTRAGGGIGAPLAVPQLATIARLAQRLGILVSRGIVAADGDDDLDLWVRAQPEPDGGVRLSIAGWRGRAAWQPTGRADDRTSDSDDAPSPKPVAAADVTAAFAARLDRALRAPLDRIIANADSIHAQSEGPLQQDYADYAADIASAGRHLKALVDDLVDLQAIERPDFTAAHEPLDLADVARRAAGLLQVRASEGRVLIDRPAAGETLAATGEFRRALQVLVNLVGNAVRYSPADGTVWVRAGREGDVAAIIVADQGKGIAVENQSRIFDKFERVDPGEAGGSGLGLYIARRLARAMGGDVTVDSAPGEGARFVFTLPAR